MRVGIINNTNNLHKKQQGIAFQAKDDVTLRVIKNAIRISKGELPPPRKAQYRKTIKTLLDMVNNSNIVEQAKFEMRYGKMQGITSRLLKSQKADIQKKKDVIKIIFMLKDDESKAHSEMFSNYIWKKMIPQIKDSKNKELADHILKITEKDMHQRCVGSISERVKFINELGSKDNIEELRTYTGEQVGFHNFMKKNMPSTVKKIGIAADKAIEKLSTNPNF